MCGIVGYVGRQKVAPILIEGLRRLQYRGYDSAGIAVHCDGQLVVHKGRGTINNIVESLPPQLYGRVGIGHTRWATHGAPNDINAHPHTDAGGRIAVVHNGIIEYASRIRDQLKRQGCKIISETDSELLAHLIARVRAERLEDAVRAVLNSISGAYGIAVIDTEHPEEIVVARQGSPVLLGIGDGDMHIASDAHAVVSHTRRVIHLEDGDIARITADDYSMTSLSAKPVNRAPLTVDLLDNQLDLGNYQHYMLKEIDEQPDSIRRALRGRIDHKVASARLDGLQLTDKELHGFRRVKIIGCGSAYIAGLVGALMIERTARIPADAEPATEFQYRNPLVEPDTLYLAVSQSGETYDTVRAIEEIRRKGGTVRGIVNVVGSSIARSCGAGLYLYSGPEISVVSTKTFVSTLLVLALIALRWGRLRDLSPEEGKRIIAALEALPDLVEPLVARKEEYRQLAEALVKFNSAYFIGRNLAYPVAMEGALKLKEVSYIHAEAYPASELKHGPLALVSPEMPTVALLPDDNLLERNIASLEEIKARKGPIIAVQQTNDKRGKKLRVDRLLQVPGTHEILSPVPLLVPLQLLSYYAALARGCNIDQPRNLAKSVTVE